MTEPGLRRREVFFSRHVGPDGVSGRAPAHLSVRSLDASNLTQAMQEVAERRDAPRILFPRQPNRVGVFVRGIRTPLYTPVLEDRRRPIAEADTPVIGVFRAVFLRNAKETVVGVDPVHR